MTAVSERDTTRSSRTISRCLAMALALAVAACFTGANNGATTPTGVIGPTGGGGSTGGGSGALYKGTYRLQNVDDSVLPFQLAYDSTAGGDSSRAFQAWIDSATLYLNSDSSAEETDYLTIRDVRNAPDSSFNREISFGDTLFGTFVPMESSVTVQLTDTISGIVNVSYTVSGSTLTGEVPYALYNTDDQLAATGQATYAFAYFGPPLSNVVGERNAASPHPSAALSGAVAGSHLRRWRVPAWVLSRLRSSRTALARTRP